MSNTPHAQRYVMPYHDKWDGSKVTRDSVAAAALWASYLYSAAMNGQLENFLRQSPKPVRQ